MSHHIVIVEDEPVTQGPDYRPIFEQEGYRVSVMAETAARACATSWSMSAFR